MNNANAVQNSTVTVSANNSLLFNTNSGAITTFNVGGLAGSGNIGLADGSYPVTLSAGGNGAGTTYSGGLSGAGGLTKAGSGTLVLCGSNTYTGGTTVAAGTVTVGNGGGSTGTLGTGTVIDDSALVFNLSAATTFGRAVSGTGSLAKIGSGTLILSGSNAYSGGTIVDAGTLEVTSASALPGGTRLTVAAGGTFIFDPSAAAASNSLAAVPEPGTLSAARRRRFGVQ